MFEHQECQQVEFALLRLLTALVDYAHFCTHSATYQSMHGQRKRHYYSISTHKTSFHAQRCSKYQGVRTFSRSFLAPYFFLPAAHICRLASLLNVQSFCPHRHCATTASHDYWWSRRASPVLGRVAWRVLLLNIGAAGPFHVRFRRLHPVPVHSPDCYHAPQGVPWLA